MPSTPYLVCVWRHAEHTVYGVLGTLYFLQCTSAIIYLQAGPARLPSAQPRHLVLSMNIMVKGSEKLVRHLD